MSCNETQCTSETRFDRQPDVDIVETQSELVLYANLPGAELGSIDVELQNGILSVQAKTPERAHAGKLKHREFWATDFSRSFRVTDKVDPQRITADFRDGVLKLVLPFSEASKPRKIQIQA